MRVRYGPVSLPPRLKRGQCRDLEPQELEQLMAWARSLPEPEPHEFDEEDLMPLETSDDEHEEGDINGNVIGGLSEHHSRPAPSQSRGGRSNKPPRQGQGQGQGERRQQGNRTPQGGAGQEPQRQGQGQGPGNKKRRPQRPPRPQPVGDGGAETAAAAPAQGAAPDATGEATPAGSKPRNRRRRFGARKKPESAGSAE
jgi:hypothetical protein